jgi:hypothetical protein
MTKLTVWSAAATLSSKQYNRLETWNNSVTCRAEHNVRIEACKSAVTRRELKQMIQTVVESSHEFLRFPEIKACEKAKDKKRFCFSSNQLVSHNQWSEDLITAQIRRHDVERKHVLQNRTAST